MLMYSCSFFTFIHICMHSHIILFSDYKLFLWGYLALSSFTHIPDIAILNIHVSVSVHTCKRFSVEYTVYPHQEFARQFKDIVK